MYCIVLYLTVCLDIAFYCIHTKYNKIQHNTTDNKYMHTYSTIIPTYNKIIHTYNTIIHTYNKIK